MIAAAYLSAFRHGGAPLWAAWMLALGLPVMLCAIMVLGATRDGARIGRLKWPFLFVTLLLAAGFAAALALPASERVGGPSFGGLPLRAAIIVYGIGLIPIGVLPIAYALTFGTQTLDERDVERARELGRAFRERRETPS